MWSTAKGNGQSGGTGVRFLVLGFGYGYGQLVDTIGMRGGLVVAMWSGQAVVLVCLGDVWVLVLERGYKGDLPFIHIILPFIHIYFAVSK